jgi:NADPH:quinone reductase-like Zn-dependent oxidoreductase
MKAITQKEYGDVEVLILDEVPVPTPAADEVLIRVHAAGLDRGVWHLMTGRPLVARLVLGLRRPKDQRVGSDVAGIVEAVGADVTEFAPGDAVYGGASGSFAEYAVAKPRWIAPRPEGVEFAAAAAAPVSGLTALQALRLGAPLEGRRVLVIGAGSGVGTFAVQLAKAQGAIVTGVCSTSKLELVRGLGADAVVDYTTDDLGSGLHDVVLDIAGNRPISALRRVLAPKGIVVFIGGENGGPLMGGLERQLGASIVGAFTGQKFLGFLGRTKGVDLVELGTYLTAGTVVPVIEASYPLERTADAVAHIGRGHAAGKTVITVR